MNVFTDFSTFFHTYQVLPSSYKQFLQWLPQTTEYFQ